MTHPVDAAVAAERGWMERLLSELVSARTVLGYEEAGQAIIARAWRESGLEPADVLMDAEVIRADPHHSPFSWSVEGKRNIVAAWRGTGGGDRRSSTVTSTSCHRPPPRCGPRTPSSRAATGSGSTAAEQAI